MNEILLYLNAVNETLVVSLIDANAKKVIAEKTCDDKRKHDANLNRLVSEILAENALTFSDLTGYAVVIGDGSWTGSRVGTTAIKAYALACPKPIVAVMNDEPLETILEKFIKKDFVSAEELMPHYNAEFITNKKN
ncbi:MAG: hypothetical protein LBM01_03680 [Christensenellaceae bacterium]|jgi:tRNA A37 threonylcarbamoyladenosine modification protein TsaB|nr:hypothetical protein [Christensenellaceae bacterium]